MKKVFLGLSGGVDSSVSAALLKEQGFEVVCVYMKNWSQDLPGMKCPWAEDLADAKRVATKLGLDFRVFDFEKDYEARFTWRNFFFNHIFFKYLYAEVH